MSTNTAAPETTVKKLTKKELALQKIAESQKTTEERAKLELQKAHEEAEKIIKQFPSDEIKDSSYLRLKVTPEMAKGLITDEFMPTFQRQLNRDNKEQYKNDIKNGDFDISTITFGVVRESGKNKFYNIDGKTRLHAVAEGTSSLDFNIIFNSYDSLKDVQKAYGKIDCGRKRNFVDKLTALEILKDKGVSPKLISKLSGIFSIINGNFPSSFSGKRAGANDDVAKLKNIENYIEEIFAYGEICDANLTPMGKSLLSVGVAAAGIELIKRHDQEAVDLFMDEDSKQILLSAVGNLTNESPDVIKAKGSRIVAEVWKAKVDGRQISHKEVIKSVASNYKSIIEWETSPDLLTIADIAASVSKNSKESSEVLTEDEIKQIEMLDSELIAA